MKGINQQSNTERHVSALGEVVTVDQLSVAELSAEIESRERHRDIINDEIRDLYDELDVRRKAKYSIAVMLCGSYLSDQQRSAIARQSTTITTKPNQRLGLSTTIKAMVLRNVKWRLRLPRSLTS